MAPNPILYDLNISVSAIKKSFLGVLSIIILVIVEPAELGKLFSKSGVLNWEQEVTKKINKRAKHFLIIFIFYSFPRAA